MNKPLILCVLMAIAAFPQAQTPLTITQSAGSATGEIRMQERRTNGQNYVGLKAPQSISANTTWTLPGADGTSGQCLQTDGSGVTSWAACGSGVQYLMTDTDWSRTISDDLTTPGTYTITLAPAPLGVDASLTDSEYRLIGAPGAEEIVTSTGTGTCDGTVQASCTIQITTTAAHSSGWTIKSSTYGLQEAWNANRTNLWCPDGLYYFYGTAKTGNRNVTLSGTPNCSLAPGKNNLTLIWANSTNAMRIYGIAVAPAGYTGLTAFKLGIVGTSNGNSEFHGIRVSGGEYGIDGRRSHEVKVKDSFFTQTTTGGTAILLGNIIHGDYWAGWIEHNTFNGPWEYGIYNRGSGMSAENNGFNGPRIHINFENWTALVNTSGTSVTWVSGDKFDTSWPGFVEINGGIYTISSVNSDTSITLASSAGTQTGVQLRHGATGSVNIQGNSIESGTANEIGINIDGTNPFYSVRIIGQRGNNLYNATAFSMVRVNMPNLNELLMSDNNFSNSVAGSNSIGFEVLSAGDAVIANNVMQNYAQPITVTDSASADSVWTITGNKLQCEAAATTTGITVTSGDASITGNSFQNCDTGINLAGTTTYQVTANKFTGETTRYTVGVSAAGAIIDRVSTTYAKLPANAGPGSTLYCSDCKETAGDNETCTSGGSGAIVNRIGSTWKCADGAAVQAFVHGGNTFGTTAVLGTNDSYGLGLQTAGGIKWSIGTTGHLTTGASGVYDIGAGINTNSPRTVYAATSMVTPKIGRDTTAALTLFTDSADRWNVTSAGMFRPAATDTYDIGDLTTPLRVRGVYPKIVDTALSGATGDYIQTRKLQLFDNTGISTGASFWDVNVVMSGVGAGQNSNLYIRDNAGSNVVKMERIASGSAVSRTTWYTDLLPDTTAGRNLGSSSLHWGSIWVDALASDLFPLTTDTYVLGNGTKRWSSVRTLDFRADGAITFSSGAANGYVWTSDASGVGSWQASASGAWTVSGSDAYRSTGAVWIGKSTNNISAKLEVENSASVNLLQLKYTGTVSSISGGGISAHQGSLPTAADQRLGFMVFGAEVSGTQYNRAAIMAFSSQTWSAGSAEGEYLQFLTTASGSTTRTARWRVADSGDWLPEAATTYSVGSSGARTLKLWTSALDASGAVSFAGSTITASSTFSSDLIPTSASTYALGSSSFRWLGYLSTLNVSSTFTLNGSITGDLKFTSANTYVLGDSTNYLNSAYVNTYQVYGQVKPGSGVTTADLGGSTIRFRKLWINDINANGTITAPDGNTGVSATKTVRDSTGTGTCTLIFSGGILTGGTC